MILWIASTPCCHLTPMPVWYSDDKKHAAGRCAGCNRIFGYAKKWWGWQHV